MNCAPESCETEADTVIVDPIQPDQQRETLVPAKCVRDALIRESRALYWGFKMMMWAIGATILCVGCGIYIAVLKGWVR